ncbi:hypothetical protein HUJ05_006785 [Dendroctonus ponderosae]|nr:hypothetical protein HUJ05_006785 [Dendroctonus ponderosae]
MNEVMDVLEEKAHLFVEKLLSEGAATPCDDTADSFNQNADLPPFYDEELFKRPDLSLPARKVRSFLFFKQLAYHVSNLRSSWTVTVHLRYDNHSGDKRFIIETFLHYSLQNFLGS